MCTSLLVYFILTLGYGASYKPEKETFQGRICEEIKVWTVLG